MSRIQRFDASSSGLRLVSFDVGGSGIEFAMGDRVGICPQNDPEAVRALLRLLGAKGQEPVQIRRGRLPLWQVLLEIVDIERPTAGVIECMAASCRASGDRSGLQMLTRSKTSPWPSLVTLLRRFPSARPDVAEFAASLRRLKPSYYPVASVSLGVPTDLDVLVAPSNEEGPRSGHVTPFVQTHLEEGRWLPIFVDRAVGGSPVDPDTPVVTVAPELGMASARAWLMERMAIEARGRNWLITSEPLFQSELTAWQQQGLLTRLDSYGPCAPGRLADLVRQRATLLWSWIVDKCQLQLCCQDAELDEFEGALLDLVESQPRMSRDQAEEWLRGLKSDGRVHHFAA